LCHGSIYLYYKAQANYLINLLSKEG